MENITLRGAGKATLENKVPDGLNIRKANDFLKELVTGCIKYSETFMKTVHEPPFAYREKQSTGMLAYALSKFGDTFQTECPLQKKLASGKKEIFGWADFWAHYRNTDFFIELKQSYFYLHSNVVTQELSTDWQRVNEQIKSFNNKNLTGYCISNSAVSIPLLILPVYLKIKQDATYKDVLKAFDIDAAYQKIKTELSPMPPTWGYTWKIKPELAEMTCFENENGMTTYLPALIFLARIENLPIKLI